MPRRSASERDEPARLFLVWAAWAKAEQVELERSQRPPTVELRTKPEPVVGRAALVWLSAMLACVPAVLLSLSGYPGTAVLLAAALLVTFLALGWAPTRRRPQLRVWRLPPVIEGSGWRVESPDDVYLVKAEHRSELFVRDADRRERSLGSFPHAEAEELATYLNTVLNPNVPLPTPPAWVETWSK